MSHTHEIDDANLAEEGAPLTEEERGFADHALAGLTEEQRSRISELDLITVVRGYKTYEPRLEETDKALKMIADWRDEVGFEGFLSERLDQDEEFHKYWPEFFFGADKHGHETIGFRVADIDTDALSKMDEHQLMRLVGQKLRMESTHKRRQAESRGQQRYKNTLIVDLKGSGMSLLGGTKRHMLKKLIDIGGNMYPESVWKIYAVNAPFVFRACWSIVKPWVHPITLAKVNIVGDSHAAVKKMQENGLELDAIPDWCGGNNKGVNVFDLLKEEIEKNKAGGAAAAAAAPAAAAAASPTQRTAAL